MRLSEIEKEAAFAEADRMIEDGDKQGGYRLLLKIAAEGYVYAYNTIGVLIESGVDRSVAPSAALTWYRRAARAGDFCGAANLGESYLALGRLSLAKKWLLRAANMGDQDAALRLARVLVASHRPSSIDAAKELVMQAKTHSLTAEQQQEAESLQRMLDAGVRKRRRER